MPARITATSCAALLTGVGLLLLAGCGTGGASGASSASRPERAPVNGAAAGGTSTFSGAGHAASSASGTGQTARLTQAAQSIIYTASLTVRVKHAATAASAAVSAVTSAGGYTAAEQARTSRGSHQRPRISLTLKVPVTNYPATLRQLSALGTQVALAQHSTDVTQQVADVSSRVTSEQDAIAQLRALLKRAGTVTALLQVQDQISGDESELEALLAQQRALNHETTYATISVLLVGPLPAPAVHHQRGHSFVSGLATGWHGLRHATGWVLTALGVLLPFLIALAVLAGLGYAVWRRYLRHRPGHPAAPKEAG